MTGEFDRQVATLVEKGYPEAAGVRKAAFVKHLQPLRERAEYLDLPFVVVVKGELVAAERSIQLVERRGQAGFSVLDADDLDRFRPIDKLPLPDGLAYLMVDVDTGKDTLNVTPNEALEIIQGRHRSPLTIDEGIALVTHHPEAVEKNGGFSLLGSRCGDRRVTALWISSGRPKLGWCWAGNPHTWLGSASCDSRIGA